MPPYSSQIQQALDQFLVDHPGGDGTGDVVGPFSSVNNHLVAFDGTTGRLLKDGGVIPAAIPVSTGANKVLFDDGETQVWSDSPILAGLTFGVEHPVFLQASDLFDDRLLIGVPPETGVTVTISPALPTGEGSNGSGIRLVGGDGSGGGNVLLVAGSDTSEAGDSLPASILLIAGYADNSEARGNVVVDSPYLNFGVTGGETGFGLRNNAGTIEAKNSGGEWAALGGGGSSDFPVLLGPPDFASATATPGTDGSLAAGTYYLKVAAIDLLSNYGPASIAEVSATIPPEDDGSGSITLTWSDDVASTHQYWLGIGTSSGGQDHLINLSDFNGTYVITTMGDAGDFPPVSESPGALLSTDGSWTTFGRFRGVFVSPGADTQVLFNDGGTLGASDILLFSRDYASLVLTPLPSIVPVLVATPGGGSAFWDYMVVAVQNDGSTTGVQSTGVSDGPAALDADNYITLTWDAVPSANHYIVYRDVSGGSPSSVGAIYSGTDLSVVDNGIEADGIETYPGNTTGRFQVPSILLQGPLVSSADTLTLGLPGAPTNGQTIQPATSTSGTQANLSLAARGGSGGDGGTVTITSGDSTDGFPGSINIQAGSAFGSGDADGGGIALIPGGPRGAGVAGVIALHGATVADAAITAPDFIVSGAGAGYKSSDGSAGVTQGPYTVITSITIKNGLVTAIAGS
jgi:hypothetical protein